MRRVFAARRCCRGSLRPPLLSLLIGDIGGFFVPAISLCFCFCSRDVRFYLALDDVFATFTVRVDIIIVVVEKTLADTVRRLQDIDREGRIGEVPIIIVEPIDVRENRVRSPKLAQGPLAQGLRHTFPEKTRVVGIIIQRIDVDIRQFRWNRFGCTIFLLSSRMRFECLAFSRFGSAWPADCCN